MKIIGRSSIKALNKIKVPQDAHWGRNKSQYLPYLGYLALLPAIGFSYIYLTGTRQTGAEVFGSKIWWNKLRPIHAILYFLFAFGAIKKIHYSWIFLLIDVIFGLISFLTYHYLQGDYKYLF